MEQVRLYSSEEAVLLSLTLTLTPTILGGAYSSAEDSWRLRIDRSHDGYQRT